MDSNLKSELRTKIAAEIAALSEEIVQLEESTQPVPPSVGLGRLTRMDAIQNKSVAEAGLRDARTRLQKLNDALERLADPGFGICAQCGQPIAPARLEYMPETTTCVNCA